MNVRLLISIAVSGAVHVGAFLAGAGLYESYMAGRSNVRYAETLTVSVGMAEPQTPASREHRPQTPRAATAGAPLPSPRPRIPDHPSDAQAAKPPVSRPAAPSVATDSRSEPGRPAPDPPKVEQESERDRPPRQQGAQQLASAARSSPEQDTVGQAAAELERTYLAEFLAELSRYKHYPRSARLRGQQGKVVVALRLKNTGEITDVSLAESSRYPALDRAALRSVRRLESFKPFPASMQRTDWRLSVPFKYAME